MTSRVKVMKGETGAVANQGASILSSLGDFISRNPEAKYSADDMLKMVGRIDPEVRNLDNAMEKYQNLLESDIYDWKITDGSVQVNETLRELSFALESDYIESNEFRGRIQLFPLTAYGSFRIRVVNGKVLILVFGSFVSIPPVQRALKNIFRQNGIRLKQVEWSSDALRRIETADSARTMRAKIARIDGQLSADLGDPEGVDRTPTGSNLKSSGEMRVLRFDSRVYAENWIQIQGDIGVISSSLNESDTIDYIINRLLPESDFNL